MRHNFSRGTCIVGIRSNTGIVVGSDSYCVDDDNKVSMHLCKIIQVDETFFAYAGISSFDKTNFDVSKQAKDAIVKGGSISDKLNEFVSSIESPYREALEYLKRNGRGREIESNPIKIVFFGIENGVPKMSERKINAKLIGNDLKICTGENKAIGENGSRSDFILGSKIGIESDMAQASHQSLNDLNNLIETDPVRFVREKIKIEINYHHDKLAKNERLVDYPIRVVHVKPDSIYWYVYNRSDLETK